MEAAVTRTAGFGSFSKCWSFGTVSDRRGHPEPLASLHAYGCIVIRKSPLQQDHRVGVLILG